LLKATLIGNIKFKNQEGKAPTFTHFRYPCL